MKMTGKKGFTLIELLVVIAIIALLLSIVMPSLKKAKEISRSVVCKTNLRNIHMALAMYAEDNSDGVSDPRGSTKDSSDPAVEWKGYAYQRWCRKWYLRFYPYLETPKIYVCPSWRLIDNEPYIAYIVGEETFYVTYTANEHVMSFWHPEKNAVHDWRYTELSRLATANNPVGLMFADGLYEVNGWGSWHPREWSPEGDGPGTGRVSYRHNRYVKTDDRKQSRGQANFMAADGRIGSLEMREVAQWPETDRYYQFRPSVLK